MPPALAPLRTDKINARLERLLRVLRVPDHIHDKNSGSVQTVNDPFGGHADGGDEEFRAVADGYFDEFVELSVRVVVVCLSGARTDLWEGEVDGEGEGFVG
jgi:hypothetical protein